MQARLSKLAVAGLGASALYLALKKIPARLELSRAKHRSLTGHARWSRRFAKLVPYYEFSDDRFFSADDAPPEIATRRREGFERLTALYHKRFAKTRRLTAEAASSISDLQFTNAYRVPFQFRRIIAENLRTGSFMESSEGVMLTDLDGNKFYDLGGSYGVNVFGYDFYKGCMERGWERVKALGPVLGPYHPVVAENVARLQEISGLDEVSFHMSGTEAVMQAVRLSQYHTGRTHLVRFCGAYHGWWGDVQPGVGNPVAAEKTYTLSEMSEATLHVLRTRSDIACVLVNPIQALHPNQPAPSDGSLVDSGRKAGFDRAGYASWLRELREICTARGIVLIFDEVFLGFRLGRGGAQEYFGVKADLVTYGKTLGGGLPIGVVCGARRYMKRFRDDKPADVCFARGTFNSHPSVMGAMAEFLHALDQPEIRSCYDGLEDRWNSRTQSLNDQLRTADVPVRIENMSSVWTVTYTVPSRYNWMLQYYLRAEGLALSWIGTGRIIFSLNYTDADFAAVAEKFTAAARAMQDDGWWWVANDGVSRPPIKRQILREMARHLLRPRR